VKLNIIFISRSVIMLDMDLKWASGLMALIVSKGVGVSSINRNEEGISRPLAGNS